MIDTFRSPRSILPMCERSISAASASASCDILRDSRRALIAVPSSASLPSTSLCPATRATGHAILP
jgi:hypothetical protein